MSRWGIVSVACVALVAVAGVPAAQGETPQGETPQGESASASTAATGADSPGTSAASYERYVALGDSYTSAPFVPLQRLDPLGCARSTSNYPSLLRAALDIRTFVDSSCAGARTEHMTSSQEIPFGSHAPQLDALTADTDLVTLGVGGNDESVFGDLIEVCPMLREQDPSGAPCRDHFTVDGVDEIGERVARTEGRVADVLDEIRTRSPAAEVYVIGYPRIVPAIGTCPDTLPFADGDYRYLDGVERQLNAALAAAAERAGARYVDTYEPSRDHDACGRSGRAWIHGQQLNPVWAAPYHPNVHGTRGVAEVAYESVTDTPLADTAQRRVQRVVDASLAAAERAEAGPPERTRRLAEAWENHGIWE